MKKRLENDSPNILQISTSDTKGGAHLAAYHLHSTLRYLGFNSTLWVSEKATKDDSVRVISNDWVNFLIRRIRWRRLSIKYVRYWISRPKGYTLFSGHQARKTEKFIQQTQGFDIINLHWIAQFIDYTHFFNFVSGKQPIVWTIHDMNPFTGGCHVNPGCNYFKQECGQCPQLGSNNFEDVSHKIWQAKNKIYGELHWKQLHLVAPSSWMAKQFQSSSLMHKFKTSVIPNGIDIKVFSPQDRSRAKQVWGITKHKKSILFVANSLTVEHKGLNYLLQALASPNLSHDNILILVGNGSPVIPPHIDSIHLDYLDSKQLASVYAAADILVMPSRQEAFGLTAVEAIACGTPVVGFDVGGIPDMVRPGKTGLLVPVGDVKALGDAIQTLLQNDTLRTQMSENCRKIAVEEYSLAVQAKRYIALYQDLLSTNTVTRN